MTCRGQRVVYTTPLKALSNQKLFEMRLRFGASRVGLQTGDATLNVDRDIVVMTTEILRNIMYRTEPGTEGAMASPPSTCAGPATSVPKRLQGHLHSTRWKLSKLQEHGCKNIQQYGTLP